MPTIASWHSEKEIVDINIKVKKAIIVQVRGGPDMVFLHTTLPSSAPKLTNQDLIIKFEVESKEGYNYVVRNFGLYPEVIVG